MKEKVHERKCRRTQRLMYPEVLIRVFYLSLGQKFEGVTMSLPL